MDWSKNVSIILGMKNFALRFVKFLLRKFCLLELYNYMKLQDLFHGD